MVACTPGEVVVTAEIQVPDPTQEGAMRSQTLGDVEVQLIPFDRDVVFDSLTRVAPNPEPEIPASLLEAQDSIATAQARWQTLEARWSTLRDSLRSINEEIQQYSQAEPRYRELYLIFSDLEGDVGRLERQKNTAFDRFNELQQASLEEANQVTIQRENWAAEAFMDVDAIFQVRLREAGREIQVDTTDAQGIVRFESLKKGQWWVHARYELPFSELYWNVPVSVEGSEPVTISLTRANADERPNF
jgi:hypothetical protein